MPNLRSLARRSLPVWALALASASASADTAADYQRSLQAVAEIDAVVVKVESIAGRHKARRSPDVQACLNDKVAEARKLQRLAGEHHGRMVEAMADRKAAAAWDSYRTVAQLQAQSRKLAGGAEGCRMLGSAEAPTARAPRAEPAPQAGAPAPNSPPTGAASPSASGAVGGTMSAAVVGAVELELD
jgi:hypothetical protein